MSYDLKLDRLIDASPEEVFAAFTDADAIEVWYGVHVDGVVQVLAYDLRIGGMTSVEFGTSDVRYREDMRFREIDRPHRLVYVETFTHPDGRTSETVVTVTFDEQNGKTLLTLVHGGFATKEERDATKGGWPSFIDRLEQVVAKRRS
jgi:uncharacterized protein YndB with AHSA1/START domain